MKKFSVIILAVLFMFILSCNNDEKAAEEAAENLIEGLTEYATNSDIDIDINEDGDNGEITISGEDGTEVTIKNEGNEIPEDFPKDVFLVKGEIESAGSISSGEGNIITVVINPEADFKDVVSEITKEMKANGWTSAMNMNMGGEALQMYSKDDNSATVTINKNGEKVEVSYLVTVAKK
ncbi:MAG: hypothetical protein L3J35_10170 [Bacteroidales bacterium]|nr:hypothetical protein [Bacteroidales bacterium]